MKPITPAHQLAFEVVTVRPARPGSTNEDWDSADNRVTIRGYSLRKLIQAAFSLKSASQVTAGPDWVDKQHFDITAKIGDEEMAGFKGSDRERQSGIQLMLQTLLAERFNLEVKPSKAELPIFGLVLSAEKLKLTADSASSRNLSIQNGHLVAVATTTEELAESLTRMREVNNRVVIDHTGLTGRYTFDMYWTPDRGAGIPADALYPGLFTALQEQLGLRLKPEKASVPVVEVVSAEVPVFD